ncbi:MAG: peptidylprolyl isomerase [Planctomycetota bacterium]
MRTAAATLAILCLLAGCGESRTDGASASPAPAAAPAQPAPPPADDDAWKAPLTAVFEHSAGTIRIRLEVAEAPQLCANFVNLAERGLFDGQEWNDFSPVVRQTQAVAYGFDIGYELPKDFSPRLLFDQGGLLCVSNVTDEPGSRTRPSRIFITVKPQDRWNLVYSVIGRITEGLQVAQAMQPGERIVRLRIEGDAAPLKARYAKDIAAWNAAIDARLAKRGATPR